VLAEQEPGDEEPRQDEEDVDSHEAAVEAGQPGVVEQDEQDRDAPEAFEIGAEVAARRVELALVFHGRRALCRPAEPRRSNRRRSRRRPVYVTGGSRRQRADLHRELARPEKFGAA